MIKYLILNTYGECVGFTNDGLEAAAWLDAGYDVEVETC